MGAIFGILNLDGQPVGCEHLHAMSTAMIQSGGGSRSLWCFGNAGLGYLSSSNMLKKNARGCPISNIVNGISLTFQGRIDNREELFARLMPSRNSKAECNYSFSNYEILRQAYQRWGEKCVNYIAGDWSFALLNANHRKLFLARDRCGVSGIYYYYDPHCFAFASSIKGLLALPFVPKAPNLMYVAHVLTSWPPDGFETAYQKIFRLPPSHTITATTKITGAHRYWFLEKTPPIRFGSDEEYVEAFLELYSKAVRCRLEGNGPGARSVVGATLSSGLDSGSVCSLAARELAMQDQRLTAFTAIPVYDTKGLTRPHQYGDESSLVEINRQFLKNLDVQYIDAEKLSPLSGVERALEVHDSPMHATGNAFWIHALLQAMHEQGFKILLTGQVGNGTVSWRGGMENFWPLLLSGRWATLWRKAHRSDPSLLKVVKYHFFRPAILCYHNYAARCFWLAREPWSNYSAINIRFARSLGLARRMKESGHDPAFFPLGDPRQTRLRVLQPGADITGSIWAANGAAYGLEVRDPTMDERIMEFCFAIPDEQYRLNGQDRALIRRAMRKMLPDAVRLNRLRGLQAADLGHRLLAERTAIWSALARLRHSSLVREVLDLPKMTKVLETLEKEVTVTTTEQCRTILMRGLMAGLFLLRFDA